MNARNTDPWTSHVAAAKLAALRDKQLVYGIHNRFRAWGLADFELGYWFGRIFPHRRDPEGAARKRRSELSNAGILIEVGSKLSPSNTPQIIWKLPDVPLLEWQRKIVGL